MSQRIYLLDTSVILPLVRGNALGKHIDQRFGLQASAQRPFVSVVSLGEVRVLAMRNDWGETKLRSLSNALDNLVVVDINHPNDLWTAACAKAAGATLLTTDHDFIHLIPDHLDGEVIDPAVARPDDSE